MRLKLKAKRRRAQRLAKRLVDMNYLEDQEVEDFNGLLLFAVILMRFMYV